MLRNVAAFCLLLAWPATSLADVRGRVTDADTGAPVAGALVYGDDPEALVTTDADGRFVLAGDAASITVIGDQHEPQLVLVGPDGVVVVGLVRAAPRDAEVIEIDGGRVTSVPGSTALDRAEVTRVPGSRGDVLSAIKNLPGVANNGALTPLSAGLIIRGSTPQSSRILVDGFEIPVLYHFLGVQSVLPSEMIDDLELQPGTFGVSHGRASAGLVSVTSRADATEPGGFAELSFVNAAMLIEGPLGRRGSYAIAGRRSVIDALLPAVLPTDGALEFTAYPRYYDYQAKATYPRGRWTLGAFAFGIDDGVELLSDRDNAADPVAAGGFTNTTSFTRAIATARYRHGRWSSDTGVSAYTDTNHFTVGADRYLRLDRDGVAARGEVRWNRSARLQLVAGAEADVTRTRYDIRFTRPPREGDPRGPNFSADALLVTRGTTTSPDLATWMATTAWPRRDLELTGGARLDVFVRNDAVITQPRGQLAWYAADGSTLRLAGGLYSRPPENLDENLQDDLGPERVIQTSAGAEQRLAPGLEVKATAFYNRMTDLIVLPADRRDEMSLDGYANAGTGSSYGVELMLIVRGERAFGWLAYTGSRAARRDAADAPERRFDYDQRHNVVAVGSWQLDDRWQLGGRFQLTTGKPYTPVIGASYQADVDLYLPTYGAPNSRRVAVQHQLDLRVDRSWRFRDWRLSAYLDVSNVYVNAAEIDYQYNFDYSTRTALTTLPILPSIGVRGTL